METYALTPDELVAMDFRMIKSSRRGCFPHGKRDWIVAIKDVYKRDRDISPRRLQQRYPHLYRQGVWIFGDWNKALCAAGFDPERTRRHLAWDEDAILKKIRRLRARHQPLYANYVIKNHAGLFLKALRHYGSWTAALVAAGVTKKAGAGQLHRTRLGVLRDLRDALEEYSKAEISPGLRLQAEHYFGSLPKAITALKTDRRLSAGWSKPKILKVLSRMHRSKRALAYAKARRDMPALVSAAEAYFGSWGKALHAAGIDPSLYFVHHSWRGPRGDRSKTIASTTLRNSLYS